MIIQRTNYERGEWMDQGHLRSMLITPNTSHVLNRHLLNISLIVSHIKYIIKPFWTTLKGLGQFSIILFIFIWLSELLSLLLSNSINENPRHNSNKMYLPPFTNSFIEKTISSWEYWTLRIVNHFEHLIYCFSNPLLCVQSYSIAGL